MRCIHFTHGSRGLAKYRYVTAAKRFGEDHPATQAALGRLLFYRGDVPRREALDPASIAWHRESGADPGHRNRTARKSPPLRQA